MLNLVEALRVKAVKFFYIHIPECICASRLQARNLMRT